MRVTFDPAKNARNVAERGLPFTRVADLDWETAVLREDSRKDYGETRVLIAAHLDRRLHITVITIRGDAVHVISVRKANRKEIESYEQTRR